MARLKVASLAVVCVHSLQLPSAPFASLARTFSQAPPLPEISAPEAYSQPAADVFSSAPLEALGSASAWVVSQLADAANWEDYAATVALSACATCAASLPVVYLAGTRAFAERKRLSLEVPVEPLTPYRGGYDSYSPALAEAFYAQRPWMVLERVFYLAQATATFQLKLLSDWRFGNLERNEKERAVEALALANELGPTFIKLGQALSIRTDLIPEAYALELRKLQDAVPPFPDEQARQILREAYGVQDLSEIFLELPDTTIASASIGQVYRGTLRPGKYADELSVDERALGAVSQVAVKVQRPGVLADIALDLHILRLLTPLQSRLSNLVNGLPTEQADVDTALALVDEWGRGFVNEVDYFAEAANTRAFSQAMRTRGLGAVISPRVVPELLRANVLVTEWIEGTRLDASASPDVPRLCGVAINAYLTMLLDTGTLHCDPHPGNLLRTRDGKLCILDWGMTLDVPKDLQYALLEFIAHINTGDLEAVPQDFVNMGFTPEDKLEQVRTSGVTDGLAFMLKQLSGGGGAKKVQARLKAEFVDRYGDVSDEELRERARADMVSRMELQLESEGVDVRGVSNVMEEMSRRNRELFQLPTWVLYVVRAFSTLEGIGLSVDEDYAIIQECYPYLARRLFKDDSPRARSALKAMLYGAAADSDKGLDYGKLAEMLDGFNSYTSATSGVGLELAPGQQPPIESPDERRRVAAETAPPPAAASDAQRELVEVLLSSEGNYVQELLVQESARVADSALRSALTQALDRTPFLAKRLDDGEQREDESEVTRRARDAIRQLRQLPGPARLALLPLTGGVEVAASLAEAVSPLFAAQKDDTDKLDAINKIAAQVGAAATHDDDHQQTAQSSSTLAPLDSARSAYEQLAKLAPDGNLSALATGANAARVANVGRRFTAALLERAASRAQPLSHAQNLQGATPETQLSAAAARLVNAVARNAADAVRPAAAKPPVLEE